MTPAASSSVVIDKFSVFAPEIVVVTVLVEDMISILNSPSLPVPPGKLV